jgi:hypothetical protein
MTDTYDTRTMPADRRLAYPMLALAAAAGLLLSACAPLPTPDELQQPPSPHLAAGGPRGIVDGRAGFRPLFCTALAKYPGDAESPVSCEFWLHRLADEPAAVAPPRPLPVVPLQVLLVTGAFSECFGEDARPFGSAIGPLRAIGVRIDTIDVGGRSGTEHNAAQIAQFLDEWVVRPGVPLVLVGYSKGTSDILQFLVDFPERAKQVDAVVSVAGSVGGSPLADSFEGLYDFLFSHLPSGHCPTGDGDVVHSLRTGVRDAWLADHTLPQNVDYYSLVAFTTRERVARALVPSWEILLDHDRRNDGQLIPQDALIPGSTLLGYLDADHWAVAMEIEDTSPLLAHRDMDRRFPHMALLYAVLQRVAAGFSE